MTAPKDYIDIGHLDEAILWLYYRQRIDTASTKGGRTHAKVWGEKASEYWRGRYEPKTGKLSITPPFMHRNRNAPQYLIDKLEEKFGGGCDVYQFNPGKVGRRI